MARLDPITWSSYQSLLAVLGKASSTSNVTRLDMRIVNPDDGFRPIRNRGGRTRDSTTLDTTTTNNAGSEADSNGNGQGGGGRHNLQEEGSDEEDVMGIEALLIMKMLCKHGGCSVFPHL